ncbi:MAG: DNA methyltransferase [Candidatus Paceibacterota bacterium]
MKYFEVININHKHAQTLIDGIRLFANPKIKHKAHVTIRGPYKNLNDIPHVRIRKENQIIKITKVDNFFSENQNTVFFRVKLRERLKNLLYKPDYSNENPHITLYDGDNRGFAENIYKLLQNYHISFQIIVNELQIIQSRSEYVLFDENFYEHLSYYLNEDINFELISNITIDQRLDYLRKLLEIFKSWDNRNVIANPCNKLISKLNLSHANGLFYYDDMESWIGLFPYRVIQAIHQIKPYAFFSLHDCTDIRRLDYNLPFVFIFSNPSSYEEKKIKRDVFNFGNAPIVIIDYRSEVKIFNGLFFSGDYNNPILELIGNENNLETFSYENIVTQDFWEKHLDKRRGKSIYNSFLQNLSEIRFYLITEANVKLPSTICNRLIGRLLFIRYFIDRGVLFINENNNSSIFSNNVNEARREFSQLIKNKIELYSFFEFFKNKYNGDLFPIHQIELDIINKDHLNLLSELFKGGDFSISNKNVYLQKSLFDIYDFSIIPIELVSNVYERFMGDKQTENKAFYTPYYLADFVLENTVGNFLKNINIPFDFKCPVLDPSCGSGIFLVEALRKIIEKKIELKGQALSNEELWRCVIENIFGIDIDSDAIDVAIFSIYVTILDYVEPKEISTVFKFLPLKETNFFPDADFFDITHNYNKILGSHSIQFIIGNPPWGHVKKSPYIKYCKEREKLENIKIGLSDYQIAQAFLIRVSDFFTSSTKCAFVVTSKILYNTNANKWRNYFFKRFFVNEIIDFSPVRSSLFEGAAWPALIVFYSGNPVKKLNYISVKTKEFFKRFNSFVINQQSIKEFDTSFIRNINDENDWFWKVMLYGSFFDYLIIKRLQSQFKSIFEHISDKKLDYGVGLKRKDGIKKHDASHLIGCKFIDTSKHDLKQFEYNSSNNWNSITAGNIPNSKDERSFPILFKAPLALIKEGLTPDIKGVAAFSNEDVVFTHSIRAIKGTIDDHAILKNFVGLVNSNLFSYFILHTGSSVGIDLTRANQIEQFSFPAAISKKISKGVEKIMNLNKHNFDYDTVKSEYINNLNITILKEYNFRKVEYDFLNYTIKELIPAIGINDIKRVHEIKMLSDYINIFNLYFIPKKLYCKISPMVDKQFVCVIFTFKQDNNLKTKQYDNVVDVYKKLGVYSNISIEQIAKKVFLKKNIIEISSDKKNYLILKSNEISNWQAANAYLDLSDLVYNMYNKEQKSKYEVYEEIFNWGLTI